MQALGKNWMPGMLVFKTSALAVDAQTTMTVTLDKMIQFKAQAITGFAFKNSDVTTTGYFTLDAISIGQFGRKILYGNALHSKFFDRFSSLPIRFEGELWENTDIVCSVTNKSSSYTIDVYIVINGLQLDKSLRG